MTLKAILAKAEAKEDLQKLRGDFAPLSFTGSKENPTGLILSEQENIRELRIPAAFTELEYLNLSYNKNLRAVRFEAGLPKLRHLDIGNCVLEELELPKGFDRLEDIYLQGNALNAVALKGSFPSLRLLDLSENKSLHGIPENLVRFRKLQYVYVYNSLILLAQESLEKVRGNAWNKIRTYLKELAKGKRYNYRAKMIVVGNGRVGKTSIVKRLRGLDYDPEEKYTHGIVLGELDKGHLEDIEANDFSMQVWDFGGQEIFYATHQFFMTDSAVYVLAWTNPKNVEAYKKRMQDEEVAYSSRWRGEQNWLENIRTYADKAPIVMVQTHCDKVQNRLPADPLFNRAPYEASCCNFSATARNIGLEELKLLIADKLKQLPYFGQEYPETYDSVIEAIEAAKTTAPYITKQRFLEICKTAGIDDGHEDELLDYLDKTGLCVHYPGNERLSGKIFIDPGWLTNCVYALLNKKLKQAGGRMDEAYIRDRLAGLKADKAIEITFEDLTELLKSFRLIFETEEWDDETQAFQKMYIYPEYLPEKLGREMQKFYRPVKSSLNHVFYLRFVNYLPENVLINIISHYGPDTSDDVVWKNGIFFTDKKKTPAIIEFDTGEKRFAVHTGKGEEAETLQREICRKFDELGRNTGMEISLDPEKGFIEWRKLNNERIASGFETASGLEGMVILNENGTAFRFLDFAHLLPEHFHLKRKRVVEKPVGNEPPEKEKGVKKHAAKGFVCYAHDSDRRYLESFTEGIRVHSDWEIFDDRKILLGEDWHERLQKEVHACDFAVLLITPYFLKSGYIKTHEFGNFLKRNREDGFPFFSVLVSNCTFKQWKDLSKTQFFVAYGQNYGFSGPYRDKQIPYALLVNKGFEFDSYKNDFHLHFVRKVEEALKKP